MKILLSALVALTGLACLSCDHGDNESNFPPSNSYIRGTYQMTEWIMPLASDLNNDGVASTNLLAEHECQAGSQLIISEDFSYQLIQYHVVVSNNETFCEAVITSGTWSRTGLTFKTTDTQGIQTNYDFHAGSEMLTRKDEHAQYPHGVGANITYAVGAVTVKFIRN